MIMEIQANAIRQEKMHNNIEGRNKSVHRWHDYVYRTYKIINKNNKAGTNMQL